MRRWDQTLFFFGRHGETGSNDKNIYRAWSNRQDAQLTEEGRAGVRESAEWLVAQRAPIDLIITDSLDRTLETAEIFAGILGVDNLVVLRGLHPLDMGDYTGKSKDRYPVEPFISKPTRQIPGGETVNNFNERQFGIFKIIMTMVDERPPGSLLVVGHGSTVSFLHNQVFNKGEKRLSYEGLVDPGGLVNVTHTGLVPLTKIRGEKKDQAAGDASELVQIEDGVQRWALAFVGGKDTGNQPKSCFNCPFLYVNQKRCQIHGPDIVIDQVTKDDKVYTPVCVYQRGGTPLAVEDDKVVYNVNVLGEKAADQTGLEWAESPTGTNCGGYRRGAPCKHFVVTDGKGVDGDCDLMSEHQDETSNAMSEHKGRSVDWDDCCDGHEGKAMAWRKAQGILKEGK